MAGQTVPGVDMINRNLATVLGLAMLSQASLAQQVIIDRCKQTSSDADRIACLEAALLGRELVTDEEPPAQIDPPSIELDAGPEVEKTPETMPVSAAVPIDEVPVEAAPIESAPEPPAANTSTPVGIGAEQVIARTPTIEERHDALEQSLDQKVASYSYVPYERLVVRLENGQVWRQIKGDTQRIRVDLRRNQTVDISEASMSGYKLRLNEIRRTIRVERVR